MKYKLHKILITSLVLSLAFGQLLFSPSSKAETTNIVALPDLTITDVDYQRKAGDPENTVCAVVRLTNNSNLETGTFNLTWLFNSSTTTAITVSDIESLAPGKSRWIETECTNEHAAGIYNSTLAIDSANSVTESDETNNIWTDIISIPLDLDLTKRISYWWGKVNQHTEDGFWATDPDGVSGANLDKLTYCQKWYPNTIKIEDYGEEVITDFKAAGNSGSYITKKPVYKCVQQETTSTSTQADLIPTKLEINNLTDPARGYFLKGDQLEAIIAIKNQGDKDADMFFYNITWNNNFRVFNKHLKNFVAGLKAGETYKYTLDTIWNFDVTAEKTFELTLAADIFNDINESNEDNNSLNKTIIIKSRGTKEIPSILPLLSPKTKIVQPNNIKKNKKIIEKAKKTAKRAEQIASKTSTIAKKLAGKLLLATENKGRIYWVHPDSYKRYEVTFGNLMNLFRSQALGINNKDLNTIPINPASVDNNTDSDDDGYPDKQEVLNGYNPFLASNPAARGNDKMKFRKYTYNRLKGRILLQTEGNGQIWYVDQDGQRWQVTWDNAMNLFRNLSLGINNNDLNQIEEEE